MNRTAGIFAGFLLAVGPFAFAQQPQVTSQVPEDALVIQQLIDWSRFQRPQPAPEPLPPRDTPVPQPDQQGNQPGGTQAQDQTPATQSFTGKIIRDGNKYVLKVASNTTYELREEGDVGRYVNQTVKVIGNLDTGSNAIHVVKIELLS
jgi:hypothetical protein